MANAWIIEPLAGTVTSATSTTVGAKENVLNDYAGVIWKSGSATTIDLAIDLGENKEFGAIALFGVTDAPATAKMQVYLSTDSAGPAASPPSWHGTETLLYSGTEQPASGGVCVFDISANLAVRYVLLRFTNDTAFKIGFSRLVIGKRIVLERNFNGITTGVKDLGALDFSARAVLLRRRAKKLRTLSLTFSNVLKAEVESVVQPMLERIGNTEMIAIVSDPVPAPNLPRRCYYGPLVGELGQAWRKADRWESKLNMVSIF